MNIARTTLSSKLLNVEKDHFAQLAVDAVLRLKGSGNLDHIQVITMRNIGVFVAWRCGRTASLATLILTHFLQSLCLL